MGCACLAEASDVRDAGRECNRARCRAAHAVTGQRLIQSGPDPFLGWTTPPATGRQFTVRHLKNKHLGEIALLVQGLALAANADLCGGTLVSAHARSGDAAPLAGYMEESDVFETALGNSRWAMRG